MLRAWVSERLIATRPRIRQPASAAERGVGPSSICFSRSTSVIPSTFPTISATTGRFTCTIGRVRLSEPSPARVKAIRASSVFEASLQNTTAPTSCSEALATLRLSGAYCEA